MGIVFTIIPLLWAAGMDAGRRWADERLGVGTDIPLGVLVIATLAKLVGAAAALATVAPCGRSLPRWGVLAANWAATGLLLGYAMLTAAVNLLVVLDVVDDVPASRRELVPGQLSVYVPWFLIGGVLFLLTALAFGRLRPAAGFAVTRPG